MKQLLVTALLLLVLVVGIICAKTTEYPTRDEMQKAVKEWEKGLSGIPVNCRRFVDLFIDDGDLHFPVTPSTSPIHGQRKMFRACEESTFFSRFGRVEAFVTGPLYFSGPNTVAFHHTILLVTEDTMCRMSLAGIAVVEYQYYKREGEKATQVLIKEWKDYFDQEEFDRQLKACSFPEFDEKAEKELDDKIKAKLDKDPYVLETEQKRQEAEDAKTNAKLEL